MMTDSRSDRARIHDEAGFGLIELVLAVLVSSVGVVAAANVSLGIGSQARLARWDTDRSVVARNILEDLGQAGYASAVSRQVVVVLGPRQYQVTQTVTSPAPRLKHIRLAVSPPAGRAPGVVETRLAKSRPLPYAP